MTRLSERELARALRDSVPTPPRTPDRTERVRRLARRLRLRRRLGTASGVVAVALAVGLPVALARQVGPVAPPAGSAGQPAAVPNPNGCATPGCDPGAVLAAIRRPLHLPALAPGAACPLSQVQRFKSGAGFSRAFNAIGGGPLFLAGAAAGDSSVVRLGAAKGGWSEQKVIWVVSEKYPGPLLLRGARIDGPGPLRFIHYQGAAGQPGNGPGGHGFPQLLYVRDGLHAPVQHVRQSIPSGIDVRAPGCYAVQVDGEGFSEVLVFRALGWSPPGYRR